MWLNSLTSFPRGPLTITVRPFNLTSTVPTQRKNRDKPGNKLGIKTTQQELPGKSKNNLGHLTIVGDVDSLTAENGLHSGKRQKQRAFSALRLVSIPDVRQLRQPMTWC